MSHLVLLQGDARRMPLAAQSVHCIVTSPPYYGLRAYQDLPSTYWPGGLLTLSPGAVPVLMPGPETYEALGACVHHVDARSRSSEIGKDNWAQGVNGRGEVQPGGVASTRQPLTTAMPTGWCAHCGAWYGQYGAEPTVELYLWHTILWLREAYRVLRQDGTLWLNLGDSYANTPGNGRGGETVEGGVPHRSALPKTTLPPGNLLLIPARIALAAQADGWILRQEVVWSKICPMPESVNGWRFEQRRCACVTYRRGTEPYRKGSALACPQRDHDPADHTAFAPPQPDPACPTCQGTEHLNEQVLRKGSWRHTRATESIFMLVKQMGYFANAEAVREPHKAESIARVQRTHHVSGHKWENGPGNHTIANDLTHACHPNGRNPRNVVSPPAAPFPGTHFATFPPSLIEPLIRASCPERCCRQCGEPWAPVVTQSGGRNWHQDRMRAGVLPGEVNGHGGNTRGRSHEALNNTLRRETVGLAPTCDCTAPWSPGIVCDPFAGSGTSLLVARQLRRHAIGLEPSPAYITVARNRLDLTALHAWIHGHTVPHDSFHDLPLFCLGATP